MEPLIAEQGAVAALLAPMAAAALILAGLLLILSSARTRRELLAQRIDMVRPRRAEAASEEAREEGLPEAYLVRLSAQGRSKAEQQEIIRHFARIGIRPEHALAFFTATQFLLAAGFGLLMLVWARYRLGAAASQLALLVGAATVAGWFLPNIYIHFSRKQRLKTISRALPDALELLVVCVEAGLSLEDGLGRVVEELRRSQPALAEELALTSADLAILPSRDQALLNFAERVDVPAVRSVVTTLSQTLRYGTPLAQSLRIVAAEMRNDYLVQLEERANRLPALLTLPVIVFIMPTIFLILGGPAALRLIDMLQR